MYNEQIIENIKNRIKNHLKGESSGHDWPHTFRVYKNSIKIAKSEAENQNLKLNFFILELSALLHDIADHKFGFTQADLEDRVILCCKLINYEFPKNVITII